MKLFRFAALGALLSCAMPALAQLIPAEDFAKHPEISEAVISPTGKYVALAVPTADGRETQLHIVPTDGGKTSAVRFGKDMHITDIVWTADDHLVVSRATKVFGEERPRSTGELFGVGANGKDQEMLFGYVPDVNGTRGRRKDNGYAYIARVLRDEPGIVLVGYYSYEQGPEPDSVIYRVNTLTGERKEVERIKRRSDGLDFDRSGALRLVVTLDQQDVPHVLYRPTPQAQLQPMPESLAGFRTYGAWFEPDGNTAYVYVSDKGEPAQLYRMDFAKGTRQLVAGKTDQEVSYTQVGGNNGVPFGVVYDAGRPAVEYVDKSSPWTLLHASLMKTFPGQLVTFSGFTRDEKIVLFHVFSDRNPGAYYQYDLEKKALSLVVESLPWIKPDAMAPMLPVEIPAKDGTKLFAFYTAKGTGPKPLVVMPHGGPIGIHDRWGYDADAQFLASRGYAVLQVNYRGSGGRGFSFEQAGWRQWGELIQDDIADAVRWAVAQGKADPARVCIYGASFGGYSALMNPIRNPGMYKCAVGYAGVYDLNLLFKTDWHAKSKSGLRQMQREIGNEDAKLSAQSPAQAAAKVGVPVFLVHGREDQTARMDQYEAMEEALTVAGHKPQTMVVDREGHGFYNPANVTDLYKRLEEFLGRNIGPGAGASASN
jgi:dipeptidyl aminopeptidase/acylaminoacyl peptidase